MKRPGRLPPGKRRSGTVFFRDKQPRCAGPVYFGWMPYDLPYLVRRPYLPLPYPKNP